ncbi:hypothetical protein ABXV22_07085 [Vibrio rotiferianus]|uniref:hypothetical protein n=1 Tax=Vibrio rotiferianus TaxID=190895 RepID=UPI00339421FB
MGLVTATFYGVKYTNDNLAKLQDKDGRKWQAASFKKAGKEAFKPILRGSKNNAPVSTPTKGKKNQIPGLLKRSIIRKDYFRNNPKRNARTLRERSKYYIETTLNRAFETKAKAAGIVYKSGKQKGKVIRYPFMVEVGIKKTKYTRVRNGKEYSVNRKPTSGNYFQRRALNTHHNDFIRIFGERVEVYLDAYTRRIGNQTLAQVLKTKKK